LAVAEAPNLDQRAPERFKRMLDWFTTRPYEYLLVPDPDEAGETWTQKITKFIRKGDGSFVIARTRDRLDPDEALLKRWWPSGL
jgi:hypothetical protein